MNLKKQLTNSPEISEEDLLEYGGNYYYIDVDQLAEKTTIKVKNNEKKSSRKKIEEEPNDDEFDDHLNIQKYELYKNLIEVVISPLESNEEDDKLSSIRINKMPFDFKVAFNTLVKDGILKTL